MTIFPINTHQLALAAVTEQGSSTSLVLYTASCRYLSLQICENASIDADITAGDENTIASIAMLNGKAADVQQSDTSDVDSDDTAGIDIIIDAKNVVAHNEADEGKHHMYIATHTEEINELRLKNILYEILQRTQLQQYEPSPEATHYNISKLVVQNLLNTKWNIQTCQEAFSASKVYIQLDFSGSCLAYQHIFHVLGQLAAQYSDTYVAFGASEGIFEGWMTSSISIDEIHTLSWQKTPANTMKHRALQHMPMVKKIEELRDVTHIVIFGDMDGVRNYVDVSKKYGKVTRLFWLSPCRNTRATALFEQYGGKMLYWTDSIFDVLLQLQEQIAQ